MKITGRRPLGIATTQTQTTVTSDHITLLGNPTWKWCHLPQTTCPDPSHETFQLHHSACNSSNL